MSDETQKLSEEEIEQQMLQQMEQEAAQQGADAQAGVSQAQFESFDGESGRSQSASKMDMILDIVLPVSIELGRTKMLVKDVLELTRGSIIELDKMAGEPVDLYINNKKMAEGEVVVVDKHFGIRITNLIDPKDRIKNLGKDI
ncbi:MAG: hypothetical protein Kow0037_19830 [Calditrichia bacterium]